MSNNIKVGQRVNGWGRVAGPEECARPCRKGEQPKICYYEWTAEYYRTLGGYLNKNKFIYLKLNYIIKF